MLHSDIHVGGFYWVQIGSFPVRVKVIEASPGHANRWLCQDGEDGDGRRIDCELWQFNGHAT